MAQQPTVLTQPEPAEAFIADRQRFFRTFTNFMATTVLVVVAVLVLMALFLA
ncbi:MAG: hypothetical protein JOY71_22880 [Acetobacteraceae bacterium]|nr:hypothetical protein [Acetobacteraceae bacterium]MBV8524927.1 hypothetical protein [Acetobacteraceae bacterium]MBV8589915.1 hypothetical protein [Acetobacteraceae bacterium]